MPSLTMRKLNAGFLLSEAEGMRSRENGSVASGQNLVDAGTIMTGPATAMTKWVTTDPVTGIILYNVNATSAAAPVSYIARDAEVNKKELIFPTGTDAEVIAALLALGIVVRD